MESINFVHGGALIIALLSLAILITWQKVPALQKIKVVPGALVVVVVSILLNEFFIQYYKSSNTIILLYICNLSSSSSSTSSSSINRFVYIFNFLS